MCLRQKVKRKRKSQSAQWFPQVVKEGQCRNYTIILGPLEDSRSVLKENKRVEWSTWISWMDITEQGKVMLELTLTITVSTPSGNTYLKYYLRADEKEKRKGEVWGIMWLFPKQCKTETHQLPFFAKKKKIRNTQPVLCCCLFLKHLVP